jgi:hypothetical protein
VTDRLVYQTSDPQFAEKAVEAMADAGISCYRTGRGYADLRPGMRQDLGAGICIFIRRDEDYRRANEILVELGAAPDEPLRLPSPRMLFIVSIIVAVLAILAASGW